MKGPAIGLYSRTQKKTRGRAEYIGGGSRLKPNKMYGLVNGLPGPEPRVRNNNLTRNNRILKPRTKRDGRKDIRNGRWKRVRQTKCLRLKLYENTALVDRANMLPILPV